MAQSSSPQSILSDSTLRTTGLEFDISLRWRRVLRGVWYGTFGGALLLMVLALPGYRLLTDFSFLSNSDIGNHLGQDVTVATLSIFLSLSATVLSLVLAALLFWHRADERMALYVSFYLILHGIIVAGTLEAFEIALTGTADVAQRIIQPAFSTTPSIMLLALFPDGRFVPRWIRWVVLASLLMIPLPLFIDLVAIATSSSLHIFLTSVVALTLYGVALYAQVYRYRRVSSPVQRQQTKWIVFGFILMVVLMLCSSVPYLYVQNLPAGEPLPTWMPLAGLILWWPSTTLLPLMFGVAILRYRLWDIDIIINRTIVYAALTAFVISLYIIVVGLAGALLHTSGNLGISLFATGLVAVLFQPLRYRLQRGVNRLMYGERDEPYTVLGRLSERLEVVVAPQSVLPTVVETVAEALRLPYAAITLLEGETYTIVAEYPKSAVTNNDSIILSLIYQSEVIGQLILAPRGKGELFSKTDMQLLETIARHASIAAYNVRLTQDLQRSRERLVNTREEERRRLRRDLHDGLGPVLASSTFKLDAIYNFAGRDPDSVRQLVGELKTQMQDALTDIRRIAYGLRPPALDELGLVGALTEYVTSHNQTQGLQIQLDMPESLPVLPAAVEVAVYYIVIEAVSNVQRHAHAHHCCVSLTMGDTFIVEVSDDGSGLPDDVRAGVGMTAMRERAAELGGQCMIVSSADGGTRVIAYLPLLDSLHTQNEATPWSQSES